MKFHELIKFSFMNLWRRKLRTSLTLLGVMIGTASIVVMMSLGIGLNYSYMQQLENSSTLTLITVYNYGGGYGYSTGGGYVSFESDAEGGEQVKLDKDTIEQFKSLAHVSSASPLYQFEIFAQAGKYQAWLYVYALEHDMLEALKLPVLKGEIPAAGEELKLIAGKQAGYNFYNPNGSGDMYYGGEGEPSVDLFESQIFAIYDMNAYYNAQGGQGQMPKKYLLETAALIGSEEGYSEFDYNVYADLSAVETLFNKLFKKSAWPNQQTDKNGKPIKPMTYDQAYVLVDDIDNVEAVQEAISAMGFQAHSEMDYLKTMQEQSKMIQYILAGIGSVSLIVAAIGIANTMLMSIFERTKEIGIFKVLGCSLGNIRSMFLTEAGLIGFSGGALGLALSFLLSKLINMLIGGGDVVSVIPLWLALLGLGFAVLVGMIAGLSPAIRATKLSPLEAIRTL